MNPHPPKTNTGLIDARPLREQVYDFLRMEMHNGRILPGEFINLKEIGEILGVSKTPLRDALIQLECEGFVEILPRRGVRVAKLTMQDIKNLLEIVGALESSVITAVFHKFKPEHIAKMRKLNDEMISAIHKEAYDRYYKLNIRFHDVFLRLSENDSAHRIIMPLKQRLYDFPRRTYIKEWELINCREHTQFLDFIEAGDSARASALLRDSHWSFKAYEEFIRRFYFGSDERIASELAWRK